jgi:oligo-1,6-glucosidase
MQRKWWKEGVIYQVYPRSFQDSNQDGIGDLPGILRRIPYLQKLGVDILWLSPIYASPNDDNGYDISDYYQIMPEFGTMEDFDRLLASVHEHGMRLVMDLVVNHSSDEHTWFQQSRASKDNPYREYYHWHPPVNGGPPNNWRSYFSGSAWEWDEQTGEYFLHLFSKKQPDLNWENPVLRQEIYRMMRFWLDKGVDGFRMDVIPLLSKDLSWADKDWEVLGSDFGTAYANGPRLHEFIQEMNREVMAHYDVMTIGEAPGVRADQANLYVGKDRRELNMIFHFGHMFIDHGPEGRMDPKTFPLQTFTEVFETWDQALGNEGWNSLYLGNHDFPRLISRFGSETYRVESGKLLATLLFTLRGTPGIYQGDEIGMINAPFGKIEDYRDIEALNGYREWMAAGKSEAVFLENGRTQARDHARTPMQWNSQAQAGFTEGEPWIMLNPSYPDINAEAAQQDPLSLYAYYQSLIRMRKSDLSWVYGETEFLRLDNPELYAYIRTGETSRYLVLLNFSDQTQAIPAELPAVKWQRSSYPGEIPGSSAALRPWEARIAQLMP